MNRPRREVRLVLASKSPRRISLLSALGMPFRVIQVDFRERFPALPPEESARQIAWSKAEQARQRVPSGILLTADTLVALDGNMLGKPRTRREAREMLARLSGRTHQVCTAMVLMDAHTGNAAVGSQVSGVTIRRLSRKEIADYVATGEPMDKAGAYGIQALGGRLVSRIRGEYYNVAGFPLTLFTALAEKFGIKVPRKRVRELLATKLKF
jgi:septum formation protein